MNKKLINWLGLLGVCALISYICAAYFCRAAFPGYNWMEQAVSDLSANNAPSKELWDKLSTVSTLGGIVCATCVAIFVSEKKVSSKLFRVGIYLFVIKGWISSVGYGMFSLDDAGKEIGGFCEIMHMVITAFVVGLSIVSLIILIIAGIKRKEVRDIGIWAGVAFAAMMMGPIGMKALPPEYFGIGERFSIYAALVFDAILGLYLFDGFRKALGGSGK